MTLQKKLYLFYASEFWIFFHLMSGVLIPFFMIWGGLSFFQLMILQAWFSLWIVVFEIPTGALADQIGRKKTILLGILANILGIILYVMTPSFGMFLLAELFWALAQALFSGAKEALLYDTLVDHGRPELSKKTFSKSKMAHALALMISAPIGSYIGGKLGFEWPIILMIIPLVLSGLFLFFIPEPRHHKKEESLLGQMKAGWRFFSNHVSLKIMAFDMVTLWSLAFMIVWFQQLVLIRIGVSESLIGWFVAYGLAVQFLCLWAYPALERILGSKRKVLFLTGVFPGIGFLLLALYPSVMSVLIALLLCSGFGLTRRTIYSSYMNKMIESHHRATINSFINMGIHVSGFLIKPIFGYLADLRLSFAFIGLGAVCILISLISSIDETMLID